MLKNEICIVLFKQIIGGMFLYSENKSMIMNSLTSNTKGLDKDGRIMINIRDRSAKTINMVNPDLFRS